MPSSIRSARWLALLAAAAVSNSPWDASAADEPSDNAKRMVGTWQYKDDTRYGGFESYSVCKADGTSVNITHQNRQDRWLFEEFTWKVEGTTATATTTRSNIPGETPGKVWTAEIISLDDRTLVCREGGREHAEARVDDLPMSFKDHLAAWQHASVEQR